LGESCVHFSLKIWHLVATILTILLRINWPNLVLEIHEISVTHNFQGYFSRTFRDQSNFPELSRRCGNPVIIMSGHTKLTSSRSRSSTFGKRSTRDARTSSARTSAVNMQMKTSWYIAWPPAWQQPFTFHHNSNLAQNHFYYLRIRAARWRECVYVLRMFFLHFFGRSQKHETTILGNGWTDFHETFTKR